MKMKNIIKNNKNKSGIYKWTNKLTLDTYIGSAVNLSRRFREYTSVNFLLKETLKNKSIIYKAILKYGYDNFNIEVLEYCESNILIEREQYYIDKLKPTYNICKIAGSSLGRITNKNTIWKLRFAKFITLNNNKLSFSQFIVQWFENKINKSDIKIKKFYKQYNYIKNYNQYKISYETRRKILASTKSAMPILVTNLENNITIYYPSIRNAALILAVSPSTIRRILNNKSSSILDNKYIIKKL